MRLGWVRVLHDDIAFVTHFFLPDSLALYATAIVFFFMTEIEY